MKHQQYRISREQRKVSDALEESLNYPQSKIVQKYAQSVRKLIYSNYLFESYPMASAMRDLLSSLTSARAIYKS